MDSKNFAIGVLSITAVILLVGVLVIGAQPSPVLAAGMTASGGEYILTVGVSSSVDEELLYVIDTQTNRLAMYRFDSVRPQIELLQGLELNELRDAAKPGGQPNQPPGKGTPPRRP